jgi:hypothetical protein
LSLNSQFLTSHIFGQKLGSILGDICKKLGAFFTKRLVTLAGTRRLASAQHIDSLKPFLPF